MPITPLIIRTLSVVECPKDERNVELTTCEKCSCCKSIEESSMIRRVFCSYSEKDS